MFRREAFLRGDELQGSGLPDVWWFRTDGLKMTRRDWQSNQHVLGMFLNGGEIPSAGPRGEQIRDDSFLLLFNAEPEDRMRALAAGYRIHLPKPVDPALVADSIRRLVTADRASRSGDSAP